MERPPDEQEALVGNSAALVTSSVIAHRVVAAYDHQQDKQDNKQNKSVVKSVAHLLKHLLLKGVGISYENACSLARSDVMGHFKKAKAVFLNNAESK